MQQYEGDFYISRICANYLRLKIDDTIIKLYPPNKDVWYESNCVFMESLEKAIESNCMLENDVIEHLHINGWKENNLKELEEILPKHIDYFKIEIYENFLRDKEREQARLYLRKAEEEYNRLFNIRHSLDHLTAVGVATFSRWQFIIERTAKDENGKDINFDKIKVNDILSAFYNESISDKIMRQIAKSDKWKGIYSFGKKNNRIFNIDAIESTDEQKRLIAWSSLYDSLCEMTDCPPDDVVDDDDALDGWLILKAKEQKEDRKKANAEERFGTHKNADEIFIPVKSAKEADSIMSMNSPTNKVIIQNRLKTIEESGEVTDDKFKDVKMKNAILATQAGNKAMSSRKGK